MLIGIDDRVQAWGEPRVLANGTVPAGDVVIAPSLGKRGKPPAALGAPTPVMGRTMGPRGGPLPKPTHSSWVTWAAMSGTSRTR